MLILPLDRRLDWQHPPLATLVLLLANVLVFLFAQLDDGREVAEAGDYYSRSGLAALEVPEFRHYLRTHSSPRVDRDDLDQPDDWPGWMWAVQGNVGFQQRLGNGQVISPLSADYRTWQGKRRAFETRYEQITFVHYGLRTALPVDGTLFSHMFLHAGIWHLLGNMLFLLAVGLLVEATLSRGVFLAAYLVTGLGSAAFNFLFEQPSLVPGIGASGAISGLMGMCTVLYGLRRIRFFYFIGVYFDVARLPAILLLPAWVGNEVLQIWLYPDSNINYLAHLGGLLCGAALAYGIRTLSSGYSMARIEQEDDTQRFEGELAAARRLCDQFEYQQALPLLRQLHRRRPDHPALLRLYYEACRIAPDGDEFHHLANRLLQAAPADNGTLALYREYRRLARPRPRLPADTLLTLLPLLLQHGDLQEAERIVARLARRPGRDARLAQAARQLAQALHAAGDGRKGEHYRRLAESWSAPAG